MDALANTLIIIFIFMCLFLFWMWFCFGNCIKSRQKTRSQQQRRVYGGPRTRAASVQGEPTIFVSPANLPPPPKYEALAPPSYEEVMAVSYADFQQSQAQPIEYPITHAIAQSSNQTRDASRNNEVTQSTVITVTADERRTSVTVATT